MDKFKPTSGLTRCGLRNMHGDQDLVAGQQVLAAPMSTSDRKSLSKSQFAIPSKAPGPGSYPIPDRAHAANALSRAAGKPEEAQVKRAVCAKFPDLPSCS